MIFKRLLAGLRPASQKSPDKAIDATAVHIAHVLPYAIGYQDHTGSINALPFSHENFSGNLMTLANQAWTLDSLVVMANFSTDVMVLNATGLQPGTEPATPATDPSRYVFKINESLRYLAQLRSEWLAIGMPNDTEYRSAVMGAVMAINRRLANSEAGSDSKHLK